MSRREEEDREGTVPMSCKSQLLPEWQRTEALRANSELQEKPQGRNQGTARILVRGKRSFAGSRLGRDKARGTSTANREV